MAGIYKLYDDLKSRKTLTGVSFDPPFYERIQYETNLINRKMAVLPTARESEALPELILLRDFAERLANDLGPSVHAVENFERYLTEEVFIPVANAIIKAKIYNDKEIVRVADALFGHLVAWATTMLADQRLHFLNLLNVIIDKSVEYYRNNGKESIHSHPFGDPRVPEEKMVAFVDKLELGTMVDALKIQHGRKNWSRATVMAKEANYIRLRFVGEANDSYPQNKYFEIAPLGSRETDFEWREGLKVGDMVDCDGSGYRQPAKLHIITEIEETDYGDRGITKTLVLSECTPDGKPLPKDNYYSDNSPVKIHSPLIAKPGTRSLKPNSNFDDSEDAIYLSGEKKPRFAIMRQFQNYHISSCYFVKYINIFGEKGGFEILLRALQERSNSEVTGAWVRLVQSMSDNLVERFISKHGVEIFNSIKEFGLDSTEKNLRNFSIQNLTAISESTTVLAQRIFPLDRARDESKSITLKIAFLCIKSDFLQKQIFGAKMIESAETKVRIGEGGGGTLTRGALVREIQKEDLFDKIIKGHPSLIAKATSILRMLFAERAVTEKQLESLWEQIKKTDIESKKALIALLKEVAYELSSEEFKFLLDRMSLDVEALGEAELELILSIKRWAGGKVGGVSISDTVNELMWKLLQRPTLPRNEFFKELSSEFVRSLDEATPLYAMKIIEAYREKKLVSRNLKLLGLLLKDQKTLNSACTIIKEQKVVDDVVRDFCQLLEEKAVEIYGPVRAAQAVRADFYNVWEPIKAFDADTKKTISQRLKFFEKLLSVNKEHDILFTFSDFEKIWKVLFKHCITEPQVMKWIGSVIQNDDALPHVEIFHSFFHSNIRLFLMPFRHEFFHFMELVFSAMNMEKGNLHERRVKMESVSSYYATINVPPATRKYHVLQVPLEKLDGFAELWKLFLECSCDELNHALGVFIAQLSTPCDILDSDQPENAELYSAEQSKILAKCLELLGSNELRLVNKAASLLDKLIRVEEPKGLGELRSFANLKLGDKIYVQFEKNLKYSKEKSKVYMSENDTLADLIYKIANEYKMTYESVGLMKGSDHALYLNASLTLDENGINGCDTLIVNEYSYPEKNYVPILDYKNEFTPQALAVFREIFSEYSTDGKMTREQLCELTINATEKNGCSPDDTRIVGVFNEYDREKKNYLVWEEFLEFYLSCARDKDGKCHTVRRNLNSLGYSLRNLQTKKSMNNPNFDPKSSIRRQLILKPELYTQLLEWICKSSEANPAANTANIVTLVEFLTPSADSIAAIVADPAESLVSALETRYLFYYRLIIVNSLLMSPEVIEKILGHVGRTLTPRALEGMIQKLCDFNFIEKSLEKFKDTDPLISPVLFRVIDTLFTAGVGIIKPDFVPEMRNFTSYFSKLKSKPAKPVAKPVQRVEGPLTKEDMEKEKAKEKDKEEKKEEVCAEDENVKRISNILRVFWEPFVQKINFDSLNRILIECSKSISAPRATDLSKHQRLVNKPLMTLICSSALLNPTKISEHLVGEHSDLLESMIEGLLHKSSYVNFNYKPLYAFLSTNTNTIEVKKVLLSRLIHTIKTQSSTKINSAIEMASYLLVEVAEAKNSNVDLHTFFNLPELFKEFAQKLMRSEIQEKDFDEKENTSLTAILTFLDKILIADQAITKDLDYSFKISLLQFLFKNCLFSINKDRIELFPVMCKSRRSRENALNLLANLCKGDIKSVILVMVTGLGPLGMHLPDFSKTSSLFFDSDRKNEFGFLGIKNLGCICYMNAMLQQFYCTPAFRYGLLMADDQKAPVLTQVKARMIDDNVFHQMQKMFAYLDASKRSDFNPTEFCLSYKDHSGEPINCLVQQDAQEFLNMIFDKLENSLKNTPFKGILESVYGGQTANVFTCKKCNFVRQNIELFYNLSLEVKNCANIGESFVDFIKEETISDYLCSNCKNKCDITKRCFLKTLPNVLIVHLKKITFDMEALVNVKLSSRYEFPNTINLRKYVVPAETPKPKQTDEEMNEQPGEQGEKKAPEPQEPEPAPAPAVEAKDEDFEYKLVGVVIHKGNAEYGHYISLINVNRCDPNRRELNTDYWLEFDDSRISPFDMTNFEEECFGLAEDKEFHLLSENTSSKSAYILVYDKVKKSDIKIHFTPENISEKEKIIGNLIDKAAFRYDEAKMNFETNFYNIHTFVPPQYNREIMEDNESVVLEQQILNKSFLMNLNKILYYGELPFVTLDSQEIPKIDSNQKAFADVILKFMPYYLHGVMPHVEESQYINSIVSRIETALIYSPSKALGYFIENVYKKGEFLANLLIQGNNMTVRNAIANYLSSVITVIVRHYGIKAITEVIVPPEYLAAYGIIQQKTALMISEQQKQDSAGQIATYLIKTFMEGFINVTAHTNNTNAKKLGNYFRFMNSVARANPCICEFFIHSNMMTTTSNFYNFLDFSKSYYSIERLLSPLLLFYSAMLAMLKEKKSTETESDRYSTHYYTYVRSDIIEKILKEEASINDAVEDLVKTVVREDRKVTDMVASVALKIVSKESEVILASCALMSMLKVEDSLAEYRLHRVFGTPRPDTDLHHTGRQLYGLGFETKLTKATYSYPTLYFSERGLIELLPNMMELKNLIVVHFITELCLTNKRVMAYILNLPGYNYISSSVFEFWPDSVKRFSNRSLTYDNYRSEIKSIISSCSTNVELFANAVREMMEARGVPKDTKIFVSEYEYSKIPLYTFSKRYLIGKTISSHRVFQHKEFSSEKSDLCAGVEFYVDRVSLMESVPTGFYNLALPENFDYSMRLMSEQNKDFWNFIDENQHKFGYGMVAIGDEVDENGAGQGVQEKKPSAELEDLKGCFFNENHIFRINSINNTSSAYFVKLRVVNSSEGRTRVFEQTTELYNKAVFIMEKHPDASSLGEVEVWGSFYKTYESHSKHYDESVMPPMKLLARLKLTE